MTSKESKQKVIRHRSLFALPTRLSFWALVVLTSLFFFLFLGYFLYSRRLVSELERDEDALSRAAAQFWVNALNPQTGLDDPDRLLIFIQTGTDAEVLRELIGEFDSPLAITDSLGKPAFWASIGVPEDFSTSDPEVHERVKKIIRRMDRQNPPLRIYNASLDEIYVVHYGDPPALVKLRLIPIYLGTILIVFSLTAVWFLRRHVHTERGLIWAGMARESAHQLGTPLSSLHGWLELLKIRLARMKPGSTEAAGKGAAEKKEDGLGDEEREIVEGIAQDIERLSKVAIRFELIGRKSTYQKIEVGRVLRGTERYFQARLPKRGIKIELHVEIDDLPPVRGNVTLLEWAFENLIKNSIDALTGKGGRIGISAVHDPERGEVDILFSDNGPGIPREVRRHIFDTGVTTKEKGWGVGLALARRIIEENHNGKLVLTQSSPEKGTVFLIRLPSASDRTGTAGGENNSSVVKNV
ncbi:MAG: HAMP domain-containing sensor histidine kinase [Gemmatimonadota bacterium]|nr:HAMP domain-containing sensor histidine kinase [Gemmatimonadota bacterium]